MHSYGVPARVAAHHGAQKVGDHLQVLCVNIARSSPSHNRGCWGGLFGTFPWRISYSTCCSVMFISCQQCCPVTSGIDHGQTGECGPYMNACSVGWDRRSEGGGITGRQAIISSVATGHPYFISPCTQPSLAWCAPSRPEGGGAFFMTSE